MKLIMGIVAKVSNLMLAAAFIAVAALAPMPKITKTETKTPPAKTEADTVNKEYSIPSEDADTVSDTETPAASAEPVTAPAPAEVEITNLTQPDANDTWIGQDVVELCNRAGEKYNICPELLMAICESESSGQQYAKNGDCIGLMQVDYKIHAGRAAKLGYYDLWNKEANVFTAADLLHELCETYGDIGTALMAYNGTRGAAERTTLTPYAAKILERSAELERLHGKYNY